MKIYNSSKSPKEVKIEMKFGYPGYDSLGDIKIFMGDSLPESKFSALPFVKVYPKKLLLKAGEEQIVRFMLGNLSSLKDGSYFCRILIISKKPLEVIDTGYSEKIKAEVQIEYTLLSALVVEKGQTECNLKVTDNSTRIDSANVNILIGFERSGNSPFFGTAEMNVYDMDGNEVASKKELSPVYFTSRKAFKFDKKDFKAGRYKVELKMSNEHKDVPDNFKIPMEPVETSFYIDLGSGM